VFFGDCTCAFLLVKSYSMTTNAKDTADPFAPIHSLAPEIVEPGMENERLILSEKERIEAAKQAANKPEEITPDDTYCAQDSAA
jgi:hypothetical protein